ncbi:hypothetical protein [Phocaeicola plebeius]|uniref:hypothetical protein n=1 Tax=Phocaeicola plebeius TaxID=310297 RepID=UPI0026EAAE52|nr:hypothetical protein [Phocaeicola plebeius]
MVMKKEKLTVKASDVRSIKMSVNPPKAVVDTGYRVIHDGEIKCWVGIGWVTEGRASRSDYYKIPEVVNG